MKQTRTFSASYFGWFRAEWNINQICLCFPDEEEDEEITAPPPAEDTQEEKAELGEQQEEGKNKSA